MPGSILLSPYGLIEFRHRSWKGHRFSALQHHHRADMGCQIVARGWQLVMLIMILDFVSSWGSC